MDCLDALLISASIPQKTTVVGYSGSKGCRGATKSYGAMHVGACGPIYFYAVHFILRAIGDPWLQTANVDASSLGSAP